MKVVKLGDYIEEYSKKNTEGKDITVYSVTNEEGFCTGYFSKDVSSKDKHNYKIVPYGYFAYNPSRINVGSIDWQRIEKQVLVSPLYVVFKIKKDIEKQYLFYYLKSDIAKLFIKNMAMGSVRDNLKFSILKNFPINLRSIEEQKAIVNKIDRINVLIEDSKQLKDMYNKLIKSRFVEMFGDPIKNDKCLPIVKMCDRYFLKAGITTSKNDINDYRKEKYEIPCYGGNGIRGYVERESYEGKYPIIGRQGALCGNIQFASGKFHATEHAILVSILKDDNVIWVYYMLEMMDLYRFHTGAAQPGLAVKTLNTIDIIVSEKGLQEQFTVFAQQVNKLELAVKASLEKLEILKKSLIQQYFG